jgi:hypothetical protein
MTHSDLSSMVVTMTVALRNLWANPLTAEIRWRTPESQRVAKGVSQQCGNRIQANPSFVAN